MLLRAHGPLDDHGHRGRPCFAPLLEALEAVEDLVVAVPGGRHPEWQRGHLLDAHRRRAGPQRGIALAQPLGRHEVDAHAPARRLGRRGDGRTITLRAPAGARSRVHDQAPRVPG